MDRFKLLIENKRRGKNEAKAVSNQLDSFGVDISVL